MTVDIDNPKFGGLIKNRGVFCADIGADDVNTIGLKNLDYLEDKCRELRKLLEQSCLKEDADTIIKMLDPQKNHATRFGYCFLATLNLDKIERILRDAIKFNRYVTPENRATKNFMESKLARDLGYSLNYIAALGVTSRVIRSIDQALPPGDQLKYSYMEALRNAYPKIQEQMLQIKRPELSNFNVWRGFGVDALFSSEYLKGKKFVKDDWSDMLAACNDMKEAKITNIENLPLRDQFFVRMRAAYFGSSINVNLSNSNNVPPLLTTREHDPLKLETIVCLYQADIADYCQCSLDRAKNIMPLPAMTKRK